MFLSFKLKFVRIFRLPYKMKTMFGCPFMDTWSSKPKMMISWENSSLVTIVVIELVVRSIRVLDRIIVWVSRGKSKVSVKLFSMSCRRIPWPRYVQVGSLGGVIIKLFLIKKFSCLNRLVRLKTPNISCFKSISWLCNVTPSP